MQLSEILCASAHLILVSDGIFIWNYIMARNVNSGNIDLKIMVANYLLKPVANIRNFCPGFLKILMMKICRPNKRPRIKFLFPK